MVDIEKAQAAVRLLLEALGEDPERDDACFSERKGRCRNAAAFWQAMKKRLKRI